MAVSLVTGYAGTDENGEPIRHVSSSEDGARQAGTVGKGMYAFDTGDQLAATLENANTVSVASGDVIVNGRHIQFAGSTAFAIPVGTQGMKTSNILAVRYAVAEDGTEKAEAVTITGEPSDSDPEDPQLATGSVLDGDSPVEMPLYRVVTTGIETAEPERLFETIPSIEALVGAIAGKADEDHTHTAADVGALPLTGGEMHGAVVFDNNTFIFGKNSSGVGRSAFEACTNDDRTAVGYGGYDLRQGNTSIYGNGVMVQSRGNVEIHNDAGDTYKNGQVLWGGKVLYANDAGSTGTITLIENAANFTLIEIYYMTNDGGFHCAKVYSPNGKTVDLMGAFLKTDGSTGAKAMYFKLRRVVISGTSVSSTGLVGESSTLSNNSCSANENGSIIGIVRVVGYR